MRDAGVVDQRGSDVRPSMRQLAERAEVTTTTVTKMIFGERRTDPETVATVAEILGVNPVEVSEWAHQARTVRASYRVPSEVHLLSGREQAAISELIRAIAEGREGRGQRPAANSPAGGSPVGGKVVIPEKPQRQGASLKRQRAPRQ